MFVIKYRKIFYTFSIALVAFCLFSIIHWGFNFGIDFTGGSNVEIAYKGTLPSQTDIQNVLKSDGVADVEVRPEGTSGYIIQTSSLDPAQQTQIPTILGAAATSSDAIATTTELNTATSTASTTLATISPSAQGEITQFDSVGPILGQELEANSVWSIILVILAIVLFITFAFRKVSEPVASWKYGFVAIIALAHDVIVPAGIFAFLGRNGAYQIDALFVTAILVILGFSVHDTIVVFDRTRENLRLSSNAKKSFENIVGESVGQTFTRSINTSLTVVLVLLALFFLGPESTHQFSLALIVGIIAGTYSSIFIGSPLLVTLQKFQSKNQK
jgi:preprotein translocase subunit SecF